MNAQLQSQVSFCRFTPVPIEQRMCWPQSQSVRYEEEKILSPVSNLIPTVKQLAVSVPTVGKTVNEY
jgi:hypothetical protein